MSIETWSTSGSKAEVGRRKRESVSDSLDDSVIGTVRRHDARRIIDVVPRQMGKHSMKTHPEKTRFVRLVSDECDEPRMERTLFK